MSSNLTSLSINKNKSRFAPKVKTRPTTNKKPPVNDTPTTPLTSTTTSTVKSSDTLDSTSIVATAAQTLATTPSVPPLGKVEETLRQLSNSTIPSVVNASDHLSITSSSKSKKSVSKRPSHASGTPIVIGAPSATTINAPTNGNRRSDTISKMVTTVNTPKTPIPEPMIKKTQTTNDEPGTLSKRQKIMMNIKDAMKKSDMTPSPIIKPTSGHSFAAPSNTTTTSSSLSTTATTTTTTTTTVITTPSTEKEEERRRERRRRIQMVKPKHGTEDEEADFTLGINELDEMDDESDIEYTDINLNAEVNRKRKRDQANKRKKKEVLLAKDMKTLDDITSDPLIAGDLDCDIKYFLKDLPRGVVTKQFRDEQIQREQEQLQKAEEAAALLDDQDALGRLAEQRLALQLQKEKDEETARVKREKEEEEAELRKKQMQQNGLAESSHALQVRMVNGQIVLDTDSMMIDRNKDHEQMSHEHMEVVEESAQSRKINSRTYGKNTGNKRWTPEETDLFYELLSQFGTDFEMIAQMIPNRSRTQVRLKYNKEQRVDPNKVTDYMIRKKKPLDLESFKKATGLEFDEVPDHFHTLQLV